MCILCRACVVRCVAIYEGDLPAECNSDFLCHTALEVPEGTPESTERMLGDLLTTARKLAAMAARLWAAGKDAEDREEDLEEVTLSTRAAKRKVDKVDKVDNVADAKRIGTIASAC